MGIGIEGPVGRERMIDYAVALTVWPDTSDRHNTAKANCKICGKELGKGEGVAGLIRDIGGPNSMRCYLCPSCVSWSDEFRHRWSEFAAANRQHRMEGWWRDEKPVIRGGDHRGK